jgi:hypothetical protein
MLLSTVTLGQDLNRLKKNTNLPVKVSIESKRCCLLKSNQMSVFYILSAKPNIFLTFILSAIMCQWRFCCSFLKRSFDKYFKSVYWANVFLLTLAHFSIIKIAHSATGKASNFLTSDS